LLTGNIPRRVVIESVKRLRWPDDIGR